MRFEANLEIFHLKNLQKFIADGEFVLLEGKKMSEHTKEVCGIPPDYEFKDIKIGQRTLHKPKDSTYSKCCPNCLFYEDCKGVKR